METSHRSAPGGNAAAPDHASETPWSTAYRRLTIGLVLTVVGVAFEALAIGTVMPSTVDDLDGLGLYGWAFSGFTLAQLIGITIAGADADRHAPRRGFVVGNALFIAGLVIGGLSPTMPVLILARSVQGFGAGVVMAVAYVIVSRGYPEKQLPRMLALLSTAWVVPGLVGPSLASAIDSVFSWRWVYLSVIPLPLIALALAWTAVRDIAPGTGDENARQRIGDAVVLAGGAALLLAGFNRTPVWLGALAVIAGALLLARPLVRLMPAGALRAAPGLPAAIATMGLLNIGFFGFANYIPLSVTDVLGHGSFVVGLTATASTIAWTAGSWIQAHFAPTTSRRRLVSAGLSTLTLGLSLTLAAWWFAWPIGVLVALWGFCGIGIGISFATLTLTILETADTGQEGNASASMQIVNALAIAIATGIGGALIAGLSEGNTASRSALGLQDVAMIGVLVVAVVVAQRLPATRPGAAPS